MQQNEVYERNGGSIKNGGGKHNLLVAIGIRDPL